MNPVNRRTLILILLLCSTLATTIFANGSMTDAVSNQMTRAHFTGGGGAFRSPNGGVSGYGGIEMLGAPTPQDYEDIYDEIESLWAVGNSFRTSELTALPAATPEEAIRNYEDFNGGEYFYRFCADYDQLDLTAIAHPIPWGVAGREVDIRNKLVRMRELCLALSIANPG